MAQPIQFGHSLWAPLEKWVSFVEQHNDVFACPLLPTHVQSFAENEKLFLGWILRRLKIGRQNSKSFQTQNAFCVQIPCVISTWFLQIFLANLDSFKLLEKSCQMATFCFILIILSSLFQRPKLNFV